MTLTVAQVRERYASLFFDFEQVDGSILRFTRAEGTTPFAVYYLDLSDSLPANPEHLTSYLDRVIGSRYFKGPASLQWNTYLYFITSSGRLKNDEVRKTAELIELDKTYARKFVISEETIETALLPPVIKPTGGNVGVNVWSTWAILLSEAGLDKAIFTDDPLPRRLAQIESSSAKPPRKFQPQPQENPVEAEPFIQSLNLTKFRTFPVHRHFSFGRVNLICGANGSGKTSLLEAIELLYCGKHKRNLNATLDYQLDAVFENGKTEKATQRRAYATFRKRNLSWYGQPEIKTSNLCLSFSQFNFLDTDAAVSLTDSSASERIVESLSKLLVGPDASKTWDNIQRVSETVSIELRGIRQTELTERTELAELENRFAEASGVRQESDSIRDRLDEMIKRLRWAPIAEGKEALAEELVSALSELVPLAQHAATLTWTSPPVSTNGLRKYCRDATEISNKVDSDLRRLIQIRQGKILRTEALKRDREALDLANQAKRMIDAGIPQRVGNKEKLHTELSRYSTWLAGLDSANLDLLSTMQPETEITACRVSANSSRRAAEKLLADATAAYENFSKQKKDSLNLAQQLRQIAAKILENSQHPDECPLCHTRFGPGDLAQHMNVGVDEHLEKVGQTLLNELTVQQTQVNEAIALNTAIEWLLTFCKQASLRSDITVRFVLAKVEETKHALGEIQAQLKALNAEIISLQSRGFSMEELERISLRLRELGYPLKDTSPEVAEKIGNAISGNLGELLRTQEAEQSTEEELQRATEKNLSLLDPNTDDLQNTFSRVKERVATTERVRAKVADFSARFPWPDERPLSEFAVEGDSVRQVAAELQAAIARENQARITYDALIQERQIHQEKLAALQVRMKRLAEANSTLENIEKKHSLTGAMENALQQNRKGIETIFLRIHSPAEFRGLGSSYTTLSRVSDDSQASLSEISSGQRAAFALSVFLAQNAQLTLAPPVILMDDPIAHVDDLNSLSFLDYLREIALTNQRQIFFATADDRLAALFERKFDFLGAERFRRFELQRGLTPIDGRVTES